MSGTRNLSVTECQAPKRTLKLYSSMPSPLQSRTLFSKDCNPNCGIRDKGTGRDGKGDKNQSHRSKHAFVAEAEIAIVTDNDVVEHTNAHHVSHFLQAPGDLDIL